MANGGLTNFGMQPSAQGGASDSERPEGTSMTDRQQTDAQARGQQVLPMDEETTVPGERIPQEQSGQTSPQPGQRTPMQEGSEGFEAPGGE